MTIACMARLDVPDLGNDGLSVPVDYVRCIADQLRAGGVSVELWLARCRMPAIELARTGGFIPYLAFRELVRLALEMSSEPALGLFVGQRFGAATHGMVGAAAVHASTVRQALDVVERFSKLRGSLVEIADDIGSEHGRVILTATIPLGEIERSVLEAVVVSLKNLFEDVTMGACTVSEVVFSFAAPEYAALARDVFGCEVRYGQPWTGFAAPAAVLDLPLKLADPAAFQEAADICQRELQRIAANASWGARLRRVFLETQDRSGFPSLQVAARILHVTARTLHRRLIDEGTSYREQLDAVRHTLALEHLQSRRLGLQEIAYRLGYTDLSNFRRAFKRWQGQSPSEFRACSTVATKERAAELRDATAARAARPGHSDESADS